jgi:hypothetical protein
MKPASNWPEILRKAWSIRFILAAGLLSGLEIIVPLLPHLIPIPRGTFAVLSFFATAAAFVARLVAQQNLNPEPEEDQPWQ